MLVIEIQNMSKMELISNYEYEVWVTTIANRKKIIAKGEIKNHVRGEGWRVLVERMLKDVVEIG